MKCLDPVVEYSLDGCHYVFGIHVVLRQFLAGFQDQIDQKEGRRLFEVYLVLDHFLGCVIQSLLLEHVDHVEGVLDFGFVRDVAEQGVDEALDGALGEEEQSVLHLELDDGEELLEFAELVGFLGVFVEVEPALADAREVGLDDFLEAVDPGFLEVVGALRDGAGLDLFEVFEAHGLELGVVDFLGEHFVALGLDVDHGVDHFFLHVERVEAEVRELLGEVVRRDRDHGEVRHGRGRLLRGQLQVARDEVAALLLHVHVEDDLVHRAREVEVHLVDLGVQVHLLAQVLVVLHHLADAPHLLRVQHRDLLRRHVVDEVVVADQRVRVAPLLVRVRHAVREDAGVLRVEEHVDARQLAGLLRAVPDALELLRARVEAVHQHAPPVVLPVLVLPERLRRHGQLLAGAGVPALLHPLGLRAAVVLFVVERLQRQPAFLALVGVAEVHLQLLEQVFDVERGVLLLEPLDDHLARRAPGDRHVRLHHLGLDLGHALALLLRVGLLEVGAAHVRAGRLAEGSARVRPVGPGSVRQPHRAGHRLHFVLLDHVGRLRANCRCVLLVVTQIQSQPPHQATTHPPSLELVLPSAPRCSQWSGSESRCHVASEVHLPSDLYFITSTTRRPSSSIFSQPPPPSPQIPP